MQFPWGRVLAARWLAGNQHEGDPLTFDPACLLQVDERMNGDGTGRPLGINNGVLGWAMLGVFTLVWVNFYNSQKELGDFEDVEAGLKIEDD